MTMFSRFEVKLHEESSELLFTCGIDDDERGFLVTLESSVTIQDLVSLLKQLRMETMLVERCSASLH